MVEVIDGKFRCDACGKQYAWKPQLAGKKARCACGTTIAVPSQAASAPPPADGEPDLYDFADPIPAPAMSKAIRPIAVPAPLAAAPSTAVGTIPYRSKSVEPDRFASSNLVHPPRDLYAPVALLIVGVVGLLAWAGSADVGVGGTILLAGFMGIATAVKTLVLIVLAFLFAPTLGISFGYARTAILKFVAILLVSDVALLWLDDLMSFSGTADYGRRTGGRVLMIQLICAAAVISVLCHYLFDMDGEETRTFALPLAFVSWVLGLILSAAAVSVLEGMLAPAPAAPAGLPAGPAGTVTSPPAATPSKI